MLKLRVTLFLAGLVVGTMLVTMTTGKLAPSYAVPMLTLSEIICRPDANPGGSEVQFDINGTGYPPNTQLREHTVVEGGGTSDSGSTAATDANGEFSVRFFSSIEPKTFTKTFYADTNGNNALDPEDIQAPTTVVITGNECQQSARELTEQLLDTIEAMNLDTMIDEQLVKQVSNVIDNLDRLETEEDAEEIQELQESICQDLTDFIERAHDYVEASNLTEQQADELANAANEIMNSLGFCG